MKNTKNLTQLFAKTKINVENAINIDTSKSINDCVETDKNFIKDILAIVEHAQNLERHVFAKRANLTEKEYEFVEATGELHYQANLFNDSVFKDQKQINGQDKCKCGCGRSRGESLPYCIDEDKNAFFGEGIILFFYFTKKLILLIGMAIFIYIIYSFTTNYISDETSQNCDKPGVFPFLCELKVKGQIQNKKDRTDLLMGQLWLGFLVCLIWSVGARLIRKFGREKGQQIDDLLDSSSDETIFLQKLPLNEYHQHDLLQFIEELWSKIQEVKGTQLKVKSVAIIYNMENVRNILSDIKTLANDLKKCLQKERKNDQQTLKIPFKVHQKKLEQYKSKKRRIGRRYQELKKIRQKFLTSEEFRARYSSECALIQFEDSEQQKILLNSYGIQKSTVLKKYLAKIRNYLFNTSDDLIFKGRYINISKAPQPSDIFWEHCEEKVKLRNTFLVWFFNFLLNGVTFGFLFLISKAKEWNPQANYLGAFSIVIVNIFNRIIWNILLKMVFLEKNYTKTINIMSVMNKSYVSQLINIIIIPILLNTVMKETMTIDSPVGLAGQTHDFQLTAFLVMIFINFIKLSYRVRQLIKQIKCLRRPIIKYLCRVTGEFDSYQEMKEAITFFYDPPPVPIAGLYVYITSITAQAFFFCHLEPIIVMYLLGNIFFFHLMNKYIVFKMSKITDMIGINVFDTIAGFSFNIPLLFGIANITFLILREQSYHFGFYLPCVLCLIVWLFSSQNIFQLYSKLIECISTKHKKMQKVKKQSKKMSIMQTQQNSKKQLIDFEDLKQNNEEILQVDIMQKNMKTMTKRKQNYLANIGVNLLFNFQNQLNQVKGMYHGYCKRFCESFKIQFKSLKASEQQLQQKLSYNQIQKNKEEKKKFFELQLGVYQNKKQKNNSLFKQTHSEQKIDRQQQKKSYQSKRQQQHSDENEVKILDQSQEDKQKIKVQLQFEQQSDPSIFGIEKKQFQRSQYNTIKFYQSQLEKVKEKEERNYWGLKDSVIEQKKYWGGKKQ